jgi:hypothetical protein
MKKLLLVGAVVMLAAAFFGCVEQVAQEEAPEYDAQGRRLVKFSVPTRAYESNVGGGGGIRALSNTLARSAWDYIEVVFKNGDEYYVGAGMKGNDINFSLPEGDYQAVMFAGVALGTKLLAVGVPTGVNGTGAQPGGDGSITIEADTTRLTFTLSALTADIKAGDLTLEGKNEPSPAVLTFQIPTGAGLSQTAYAVDSKNPPYFTITGGADGIAGAFSIGGFNDGSDPPATPVGVPDDPNLFEMTTGLFGVLDSAPSTKIIQAIGVTGYDAVTGAVIKPVEVSAKVNTIGIDGGVLAIGFELATNESSLNEGFSKLWFDVPIQAFNDSGAVEAGRGSKWHIVNGLEAVYDEGEDSMGRNILLYAKLVKKYYVSAAGDDLWDGKTPETAFRTLMKAYTAAKGNVNCERIVVLTDIAEAGLVTFDGSNAVNTNMITIEGAIGAEKLTRNDGTNDSVIQIEDGAKIAFKRIKVDGKYSDPVYNRGLYVTGTGTEVTLGDGAVISGSLTGSVNNGGGVQVAGGARLTMTGGKISDSKVTYAGAGVYMEGSGSDFTMTGGKISGNTAGSYSGGGGGVYVYSGAFTMIGGEISGNTTIGSGGGVFVYSGGTFEMTGGEISGNTAADIGGGVYMAGAFTMHNGVVSGNTASNRGGGVFVGITGTFTKAPDGGGSTSGVIYGYTETSALGNLVGTRKSDKTPDTSHVPAKGDAVWYANGSNKYRDSTLNTGETFSHTAGPWDN